MYQNQQAHGRRGMLKASATVVGAALTGSLAATGTAAADAPERFPRGPATFPMGPFTKSEANPILRPEPSHEWESAYLYNPCALVVGGRIALLYRAQNKAKRSSIGLGATTASRSGAGPSRCSRRASRTSCPAGVRIRGWCTSVTPST
ncbi:hypothetical protein [Streptomyces endophyticus]|uniref:hypothetical protein n=1 Tax=Streptomyces endophyticus TaxID=714166 RepID=UPI002DB8F4A0|nr:hypothetical protein [Streptomyces endophyticus]